MIQQKFLVQFWMAFTGAKEATDKTD